MSYNQPNARLTFNFDRSGNTVCIWEVPKQTNHLKDQICIFVPLLEWLFKDTNLKIAKDAALAKTITLIAVDEVHLICEWQSFDLTIETWNQ